MQSAVIVVCILRTAGLQDAVDKMMEQYRVRGISQGIVDFLALPPGLQETCVPEAPEVMGHRRGAHAGGSADIEDALLAVAEQPENLQPGGVAELLESRGHDPAGFFRGHCRKNIVNIAVIVRHLNLSCHIRIPLAQFRKELLML